MPGCSLALAKYSDEICAGIRLYAVCWMKSRTLSLLDFFLRKKKPRVIIFYHIWSAPFAHGRYGAWGFILIILGTFGSTTGPLEKMLKKDGNCAWLLNIVHHRPNAGIRAVHLSASQPNVCGIKKSRGAYWIRWNISFVFSKPYDYYRIWLQSILWWSHLILLVIKNVL